MSQRLKLGFILAIVISLILASWWVINGDITFSSDIARDFLLFAEITQKKIVLIGPKSSVEGLFHGPLWIYLNYPAYLLGNGSPVVVGWFWILLCAIFAFACYKVGKSLFDELTGYLFASMTALYMVFHAHGMFNPDGAMFLIPINFAILVKYFEKKDFKLLALYVLISGLIIHFELAIGIPLFALSVILLVFKLIRTKQRAHLLALLLIILPLLNFVAFELKHQFLMLHSVMRYLSPTSGDSVKYSLSNMLSVRSMLLTTNVEILRFDPHLLNSVTGAIFIFFFITQIKNKKHRNIYFLFLYFYVGYFVTTLINRGPILYFYFYPFFPLVFLIFSSFSTSKYKPLFLLIFGIIYILNIRTALTDISDSRTTIGIHETSWKFLSNMAGKVYSGKEKEFGYFVYTPDIIGYGPKYALLQQQKVRPNKNASYFAKKNITYIVVATPAANNPYLSYEWWRKNRLKIDTTPASVVTLKNGWRIERYNFTDEEVKIPFDAGVDPGLGFR